MEERVQIGCLNWNWKSSPNLPSQVSNLICISSLLGTFQPTSRQDRWICGISGDGKFHVDELRHEFDRPLNDPPERITTWIHDVTLKVMCFIWRTNLGRIPSAVALKDMGVDINNTTCRFCTQEDECANHILFRCPFAIDVWEWICKWFQILVKQFDNVGELMEFVHNWGNCMKRRKSLLSILSGTVWWIWKVRCD